MEIRVDSSGKLFEEAELKVVGIFQKDDAKSKKIPDIKEKELKTLFQSLKSSHTFGASLGERFFLNNTNGDSYLLIGLGNKKALSSEVLRKQVAAFIKSHLASAKSLAIDLDSFFSTQFERNANAVIEGALLSDYKFDKYKTSSQEQNLKEVSLKTTKKNASQLSKIVKNALPMIESMKLARDYATEVPNFLNSVKYASLVEQDVKKNLKGVKVKILNKADIKKERMELFLSVNAGSAYEPRLVHLTYTPKKKTRKMKHIALVGKGITFDTGGYSLKPSASIMGMKYDMAGSSTVYGAFRAAVLQGAPHKLTCIMAITDNAVSSKATFPDSVIKTRNGKTVEILNTDAEGRLALADALDYTCDLKPDVIFDAATLTGACLVALGDEVCGLMSNDESLVKSIKKAAQARDEYIWELPIVPEFRDHIKSKVADIKNIGKPMRAGTAVAGAFLQEFIKNGISWAHFDIAGVANNQDHLPYCTPGTASALMVRTMVEYIHNA